MYFQPNAAYVMNKRTPAATKISIFAFNGPRNSELEEKYDRQLLLESNERKENFSQGTLMLEINQRIVRSSRAHLNLSQSIDPDKEFYERKIVIIFLPIN